MEFKENNRNYGWIGDKNKKNIAMCNRQWKMLIYKISDRVDHFSALYGILKFAIVLQQWNIIEQ